MKKRISALKLVALAIAVCAPGPLALGHERDTYKIGGRYYLITVGSLNEPFVVDNMSGVDLRVAQIAETSGKGAAGSKGKGTPVSGLEQTLKVEIAAGDRKETLSIDPSDSGPGSYAAPFIPTVQTTYSYRIFGTIDSSPVDLTFACTPGEVSESTEDNSQLRVSDTVVRVDKIGAFGCPGPRDAAGFPEPALSSYEMSQKMQNLAATAQAAGKQAGSAQVLSAVGFIVGLSGLAVAGMAWRKR